MVSRNAAFRSTPYRSANTKTDQRQIRKLMCQRLVEVVPRAYTCLALYQLGQIADVADESEHQLLVGPGAAEAGTLVCVVSIPHLECETLQLGQLSHASAGRS